MKAQSCLSSPTGLEADGKKNQERVDDNGHQNQERGDDNGHSENGAAERAGTTEVQENYPESTVATNGIAVMRPPADAVDAPENMPPSLGADVHSQQEPTAANGNPRDETHQFTSQPGAFHVFPMNSSNGGRVTVTNGAGNYLVEDQEGGETDGHVNLEDELDRLGIPFAGAVEVMPVVQDEAGSMLIADSRLSSVGEGANIYNAERVPTINFCGKKIARSTATLLACLLALVAAAAIAVPISIIDSNNEEDPEKFARKARISEEISTFAMGDIDNPKSPHGQALEWMLGESNAHMDAPGSSDLIKQRFSLAAFYYSTGGDSSWRERGNFLSADHVCEWSNGQVICDEGGDVVELNLADNNLQGTLPQEIKYLHSLKHLNLTRNRNLSGGLLAEIGELAHLQTIDFFDNSFSGSIPSSFGNLKNLTHLVLHNNDVTSYFWVHVIRRLKNLRHLDLGENQLYEVNLDVDQSLAHAGGHPERIFIDLKLLEYLDLSGNMLGVRDFAFEISSSIGTLSNLRVLNMASNNIRGSLPTELGMASKLEELMMNDNDFRIDLKSKRGGIPTELGELKELRRLDLSYYSNIAGQIPSTLGNLSKLEYLNLNYAGLTGQIPEELGNLKSVEELWLERNVLTGVIPAGIFHEKLELFLLGVNKLTGTIPTEIGNAFRLKELLLGENKLEGPIPSEIGNLIGLEHLELDGNELNGEVPTTIGNLINLARFDASDNSFSGTLPTELGKLTALTELGLSSNNFTGKIPTELGNLVDLLVVHLDGNTLSGNLPG